jgi:hypothetical protein
MNRLKNAEMNRASEPLPSWISLVHKAAASIRFGSIQIKVHDGEIVQIETTSKLRLDDLPPELKSLPTEHTEAQPPKSIKAGPTRSLEALPRN